MGKDLIVVFIKKKIYGKNKEKIERDREREKVGLQKKEDRGKDWIGLDWIGVD